MIVQLKPNISVEATGIEVSVNANGGAFISLFNDIPFPELKIRKETYINLLCDNEPIFTNYIMLDMWNIEEENKLVFFGKEDII